MEKEIITITKAAEYLHVHINTLRNWVKSNKIKVIRTPGGHFRIPKDELIKLMKKYNFPIPDELTSKKFIIFLIDDDQKLAKLYNRYFKKYERYELHTFSNGFDALLKIESLKPNLILLDIFMPKIDGFEFVKKLKENKKWRKKIKIIAISNYKKVQEKAMKSGIDDFFYKGDDITLLYKKIEKLIGKG